MSSEFVCQMIAVEQLIPTNDNPRKVRTNTDSFRELAQSIRVAKILQPLLARPNGDGTYDLRCGHRRLAAAKSVGETEVPVVIREMSDRDAKLATVIENRDREDLLPIEDARSVKLLLDDGMSIAEIAENMKRPANWVARRAKLNDLKKEWKAQLDNEDSPFAGWSAAMLEEIARLPADTQLRVLNDADEEIKRQRHWNKDYVPEWTATFFTLRRHIAREYMHDLRSAPFSRERADLVPAAGACAACPKRSGANPTLFSDIDFAKTKAGEPDVCMDSKCWQGKVNACTKEAYARAAEKAGVKSLPIVENRNRNDQDFTKILGAKELENSYTFSRAKADDKGAVAAFDVQARQIVHLKKHNPYSDSHGSKKAEKRKASEVAAGRRHKHVLQAMNAIMGDARDASPDKPLPGIRELSAAQAIELALGYGTDWADGDSARAAKAVKADAMSQPLVRRLVQAVIDRITNHIRDHNTVIATQYYPNAAPVAQIFAIDLKKLEAEALEAFPEPKSKADKAKAAKPAKGVAKKGRKAKSNAK